MATTSGWDPEECGSRAVHQRGHGWRVLCLIVGCLLGTWCYDIYVICLHKYPWWNLIRVGPWQAQLNVWRHWFLPYRTGLVTSRACGSSEAILPSAFTVLWSIEKPSSEVEKMPVPRSWASQAPEPWAQVISFFVPLKSLMLSYSNTITLSIKPPQPGGVPASVLLNCRGRQWPWRKLLALASNRDLCPLST